jgi:hypothetical protein
MATEPEKNVAEPVSSAQTVENDHGKKEILLNAFDMSTVGHLSPGQWKVC